MPNPTDGWLFSDQELLSWLECGESPDFLDLTMSSDAPPDYPLPYTEPQASSTSSLFNLELLQLPPNKRDDLGSLFRNDASRSASIVPTRLLSDATTTFVSYYFRYIGPMFCCCREIENPFINDVAQRWNSWSAKSLPYVLQSMSLTCLADTTPHLLPVASEFRQKAKRILEEELSSERDKGSSELSIILLGASAGWMRPQDSMLDLFQRFVSIAQHQAAYTHTELFQRGVMTYWHMFLTFMSSAQPRLLNLASSTSHDILMNHLNSPPLLRSHPHPWTGISVDLIILLTQVGQLVRHHEATASPPPLGCCSANAHESAARSLESKLLQHCKREQQCHDRRSSSVSIDLVRLSELYQIAALLQLYRVFPGLAKGKRDRTYETVLDLKLFSEAGTEQNLLSMARHILDVALEAGPDSSVSRFQLVPVIIACTELRLPGSSNDEISVPGPFSLLMSPTGIIAVAQARQLGKNHLMAMRRVFPGDRVSQVIKIIAAMWEQLDRDGSNENMHWIKWLLNNGHDVT
ncbi:hypothetical protein QQX98_004365 [Neonectria punicea]|uniref:Transcription factor domain-containing protein n=1 Tax=Neonectria punicea TaxID=979145 RepID=A0ABR1H9Y4_9HYPO